MPTHHLQGFLKDGGYGVWGLDIRNRGITDQRVPLSSWMRSFRGRQKSCFPAHMLPAAPIYQSVRRLPGCAQSEHHAGVSCNRMHSFGKQHSSVLWRRQRRRKECCRAGTQLWFISFLFVYTFLFRHRFVTTKCLGHHKLLVKVIRKLSRCGYIFLWLKNPSTVWYSTVSIS